MSDELNQIKDELKQRAEQALTFLDENLNLLKTGKWELRNNVIRCENGECPLLFLAHKKGIINGAKEDWWNVNKELLLSYEAAQLIAHAIDGIPLVLLNAPEVRNKLLLELNPIENSEFGVYNEK